VATSLISAMVLAIPWIDDTASVVEAWIAAIWPPISSVAVAVLVLP